MAERHPTHREMAEAMNRLYQEASAVPLSVKVTAKSPEHAEAAQQFEADLNKWLAENGVKAGAVAMGLVRQLKLLMSETSNGTKASCGEN
jgi:hypothetical protein